MKRQPPTDQKLVMENIGSGPLPVISPLPPSSLQYRRMYVQCGSVTVGTVAHTHTSKGVLSVSMLTVHNCSIVILTFEPAGVWPLGVLEGVGLVRPCPSLRRALLLSSLSVACSRCSSWWCATHPMALRRRPRTTALPQLGGAGPSVTSEGASGSERDRRGTRPHCPQCEVRYAHSLITF